MKKFIITLTILLIPLGVWAQFADEAKLQESSRSGSFGVRPVANPFSLLDLSRLRWSHSYALSYGTSSGQSGTLGRLNSTMFYEFSSKLSLAVNLGMAHTSGSFWNANGSEVNFLPGLSLDYHPSEKFRMSFIFEKGGGLVHPYRHRSNYWHDWTSPY